MPRPAATALTSRGGWVDANVAAPANGYPSASISSLSRPMIGTILVSLFACPSAASPK